MTAYVSSALAVLLVALVLAGVLLLAVRLVRPGRGPRPLLESMGIVLLVVGALLVVAAVAGGFV